MRRTVVALLAAVALALSGCSSSGEPEKPAATVTATKTPERSQAELRAACVDAWAEAIEAGADDDEPAVCADVEGAQHADMYMEGLRQRNQANRDEIAECVEDPACTSVPVP
jgi:hypothetical protein